MNKIKMTELSSALVNDVTTFEYLLIDCFETLSNIFVNRSFFKYNRRLLQPNCYRLINKLPRRIWLKCVFELKLNM